MTHVYPRFAVERNGRFVTLRRAGAVCAAVAACPDAAPASWEEIEEDVVIPGGEIIKVKTTLVNGNIRVTAVDRSRNC